MNRKRRTRYLLAVYLLVASLAISLALAAIHYSLDPMQTLLLNLSTELLGVVTVYFLVNRLFLAEEWDLSERIEGLVRRLERQASFLRGQPSDHYLPFDQRIGESSNIGLLGYSFVRLLKDYDDFLTQRVCDGARLRIMIVNPDSKAGQLILENLDYKEFEEDVRRSISYAKAIAKQNQDNGKGQIEVRLLNWVPSCALILSDTEKPNGHIMVTIYPPYMMTPISKRAYFFLKRPEEDYWYSFFADQFEGLWSRARPIDLID